MTTPLATRATYADLLAVPDHQVAELIDGVLYVSPRPAPPHARASSSLGGELYAPFGRGRGGPGGWVILDEPELHVGDAVLVPDLAGWRVGRFPGDGVDAPFVTVTPDWVCEVISPSTARLDRTKKAPLYAGAGVAHLWFVEPLVRTLEVMRLTVHLTHRQWLVIDVFGNDDVAHAEPFQAYALELSALWL